MLGKEGFIIAILKDIINEEYQRLIEMEKAYMNIIQSLPKGTIITKRIKGQLYPYLCYRDGLKVRTVYLKQEGAKLEILKEQITQRRQYERILKEIRKDLKITRKIIK
ncbi:MAG TPA: hypothetical protein PLW11_05865 [Bacillota bacterium]|nr:hypothetical protein [Bacillota bacterium]